MICVNEHRPRKPFIFGGNCSSRYFLAGWMFMNCRVIQYHIWIHHIFDIDLAKYSTRWFHTTWYALNLIWYKIWYSSMFCASIFHMSCVLSYTQYVHMCAHMQMYRIYTCVQSYIWNSEFFNQPHEEFRLVSCPLPHT